MLSLVIMQDFTQEPVATTLRLLFLAWVAIGLWVLLFCPLFTYLKGTAKKLFPSWWKVLLVIYTLSISVVAIVAYNTMRHPGDLATSIGYIGLFLGYLTLIVGSILAAGILLPALVNDGIKNIKTNPKDVFVRILHVLLILAIIAVIRLLILRF